MKKLNGLIPFLTLILGLLVLKLDAQNQNDFTFTQAPSDHQLYPRNGSNQATVTFSGTINWTVPYQFVKLKIFSRNFPGNYSATPITTLNVIPTYINSATRSFYFTYLINGSLTDYMFSFGYTYNNTDVYFKNVTDVVAGDVYVVTGQSNSLALGLSATDDDPYLDHYSRAYGMNYDDAIAYCNYTGFPSQTKAGGWGEANAYSNPYFSNPAQDVYSEHFAGLTGLRFAKSIIQNNQVPVAIIHGGAGGQEISNFLSTAAIPPYYTGLTTYSIYNFLKQKLIDAGVQNKIKAIVWYQGEADALYDAKICNYQNNFQSLYNSWKTDYSSIQRIYMMQVNTILLSSGGTCSSPVPVFPNYNDMHITKMRNVQRLISQLYTDVTLVPTVGGDYNDRPCDQLHYTVNGYARNGILLYKLISKQLYTYSPYTDDQAYTPVLFGITCSGNVINLEFTRNVSFQNSYTHPSSLVTFYLKDHFFNESDQPLALSGISANGKILSLTLAANTPMPSKLTYLPSHEYNTGNTSGSNYLYVGPWITNSDGTIGVSSFYQVPVGPDFTAGLPTCQSSSLTVSLSTPAVPGLNHMYQIWQYDQNTGHFTGQPLASLNAISGTMTLPGPGTYAITHASWGTCQPWQFTEIIYSADNLARFTSTAPVCSGYQTQMTATASTSTPNSSWKIFLSDANATIGNLVQTYNNVNSCLFTNLTPGQYYVIEHKSWGGCATSTHTFTQLVFVPGTVSLNSGIGNVYTYLYSNASINYISVSATAASVTPNSYWDIRPSDAQGTLTAVPIGNPKYGNSAFFTRDYTNTGTDYILYPNQFYLLVHGVWSGCATWTWTGYLVYVPARLGDPAIVTEILSFDPGLITPSFTEAESTFFPLAGSGTALSLFSLFPNPGTGAFTLNTQEEGMKTIIITDITGRVISKRESSEQTIAIDLQNEANGSYFVQVISANGSQVQQLIKE